VRFSDGLGIPESLRVWSGDSVTFAKVRLFSSRESVRGPMIPAVFPYRMNNNPETQKGFTGGKVEQFDAPLEPVA
jgi:hypothetical protein